MLSELELLRQQVGELEVKPNQLLRLQEYFRMFKAYIICLGVSPDSELAKEQFINGLSAERFQWLMKFYLKLSCNVLIR